MSVCVSCSHRLLLAYVLVLLVLLLSLPQSESVKASSSSRARFLSLLGSSAAAHKLFAQQRPQACVAALCGALQSLPAKLLRPVSVCYATDVLLHTLANVTAADSVNSFNSINGTATAGLQRARAQEMLRRMPSALLHASKASAWSFANSASTLVPIALVLNVNMVRQPQRWLRKGLHTGVDWAKIGAYFVAGEKFSAQVRNRDDKLNSYIGSGISSGLLNIKEGPVAMARGFATGFAFMFVLDKFVVDTHPSAGPTMEYFQAAVSRRPLPSTSPFTKDMSRFRR